MATQRTCITNEELEQEVFTMRVARDERIVSAWLEKLSVQFIKEKVMEAMLNGRTSVLLIRDETLENERRLDMSHLICGHVGNRSQSVVESILGCLDNSQDKYRVNWKINNNSIIEIELSWSTDASEWEHVWENGDAQLISCGFCCLVSCLLCCVCCGK